MDLIGRTWRLLPLAVRARIKASLATRNIGRTDLVEPAAPPPPPSLPQASPADARLGRLSMILDAPTEMSLDERLFLYALVRGSQPARVLEIGTSQGGSAAIIASALEDNGSGVMAGIDPLPRIDLPPAVFNGRFHLVTDMSPNGIAEAARLVGGTFDLVLVDGAHIYQQSLDDVLGALPYTSERAYVLFHDAFHFGVSEAIREAVECDPTLHDCGYVCRRPRRVGDLLTHAGFRLVRRGPGIDDPMPWVEPVWREIGLPPPHDPDLRNHDIYVCEYVEPCDHCRKEKELAARAAASSTG